MNTVKGKGETDKEAVPEATQADEWRCTPCGEMEDIEPLRSASTPVKPDEATVALHRKTHIPYRSWCSECIMGRGLCEQRGRHVGRPHDIPRVGIDYWFITTGSVKLRHELDFEQSTEGDAKLNEARKEGKVVKCLIIRCYETKCIFAYVVPVKGADEDGYAVQLVVNAVVWLGHVRVILKSDGEPAVTKLVQESLKEVKCSVEPHTNGAAPTTARPMAALRWECELYEDSSALCAYAWRSASATRSHQIIRLHPGCLSTRRCCSTYVFGDQMA